MEDNRILYDAFNIYYNRGMEALKKNNYEIAKRNLYAAADSILKLAKTSNGVLKAERLKRAEELAALVSKIDTRQRQERADVNPVLRDINRISEGKRNDCESDDDKRRCFAPVAVRSTITLDDVAGLCEAKDAIRRLVIEPRKYPEIYEKFKKRQGGGILLYGVPGTGKTMLAQAIASEIDAAFFSIKCSDIVSKYFGEAEQNIKNLFAEARKHPNAIIFFDEFESLGATRDTKSTVMKRIIPELLAQVS